LSVCFIIEIYFYLIFIIFTSILHVANLILATSPIFLPFIASHKGDSNDIFKSFQSKPASQAPTTSAVYSLSHSTKKVTFDQ
jgi:hypothetical protein